MKQIIDTYGNTILLCIIGAACLTMFCNIWFGSGAMISNLATTVFGEATSDSTVASTRDQGQIHIVKADGTLVLETQQDTAATSEDIAVRREPILYGVGTQNDISSQLLIGTEYSSTDLLWAVDADDNIISTSINATNAINNDGTDASDYFNESGYFRILSISKANGDKLIKNCSDFSSINYDCVGSNSYIATGDDSEYQTFIIKDANDADWFSYNMQTQSWLFYKAGTYCLKVFVCDSSGKDMTGTVYISVAQSITHNDAP